MSITAAKETFRSWCPGAGICRRAARGQQAFRTRDGGALGLFGVQTAVIGGASLFGGCGKPTLALIGGFVIATVYNGLDLMGVSAAVQDMATGVVLVLAVTIDCVVRRRSKTTV